jgi:hypothetical protein
MGKLSNLLTLIKPDYSIQVNNCQPPLPEQSINRLEPNSLSTSSGAPK